MKWLIGILVLLAACTTTPTGMVVGACMNDPYFRVATIDNKAQACYDDKEIVIVVENGPEQDIHELYIVVKGDAGAFSATEEANLAKGFATTLRIPYDWDDIATPSTVAIMPLVEGAECADNMITAVLRRCD